MVLLACGSHKKPGLAGCGAPGTQAGGEMTVAESLAELEALPTPPGVSDEFFQALKDVFERALADAGAVSGGKFVSTPPDGDANKVVDLHFRVSGEDYYLAWGYRNVGDYNQDSTVSIPDITPLAAHFNENVIDHPEADPIDGNGDTVITILDLTPLAANFTVQCSKYAIEGAPDPSGPWETVEVVLLSEASEPPPPGGRRQFDHLMPTIGYAYFRVVPMDDSDNRGIPSDPIAAPVSAPVISGVSPTTAPAGTQWTFTATVSGSEPFTYAWTFGDAATPVPPSTLNDAEPVMQITDTVDTYACSVTVSNDFGEDLFGFDLEVAPPAFSVSGTVTETGGGPGIPGVTLTLSPGPYEGLTGGDGTYIITDVPDDDYTLTPSKTDYVFDPTSRDVTVAGDDVAGQDFTGEIPPTYTVSGHVEKDTGGGLASVTLSLGGGLTDTTDSTGDFAITDVPPGSYTLTPGLFGYTFLPPSRHVDVVDADVTGQNFIAEEPSGNWLFNTIDGTVGLYNNISLMIAGGKPAVAYSFAGDGTPDNAVKFARSPSADGSGSWTSVTRESDNSADTTGNFLSGAMVGGHPAIAYNHEVGVAPDHLKYTYNSAADGSGSWNGPVEFDNKDVMQWVSLADIGGLPAICYQSTSGAEGVFFASNSAADGSGSWVKNTVESGGMGLGSYSSIADVGGRPGVGFYFVGGSNYSPKFAINSNADGSGTWSKNIADPDSPSGANLDLIAVAGRPAMSYQKSKALYVSIAPNPDGSGTWAVTLVDDANQAGSSTCMAIVGGYPAIAYYVGWPDYDLKFAVNSAPDGSGSWGTSVADSAGDVGKNCSMVDIGGKPAIAYWDYTNKTLKFALMQ